MTWPCASSLCLTLGMMMMIMMMTSLPGLSNPKKRLWPTELGVTPHLGPTGHRESFRLGNPCSRTPPKPEWTHKGLRLKGAGGSVRVVAIAVQDYRTHQPLHTTCAGHTPTHRIKFMHNDSRLCTMSTSS